MTSFTIHKLNPAGQETYTYTGRLVARSADRLVLEAEFSRDDYPVLGIVLRRGDRFVETYFTDRWYNIYTIYDRDKASLKAWYCNIGHPAQVGDHEVSYIDLALDLLVYPDGRQVVLDEDEFAALALPAEETQQARRALQELQAIFTDRFTARPGTPADRDFDW